MARIIPWTLPPVKGGSIGGYTEHGSGSGGDTPAVTEYFNFDDATLLDNCSLSFTSTTVGTTDVDVTSRITSGSLKFTGLEVEDLVGVSSLKVAINSVCTASNYVYSVTNTVFSIDPITMAATYLSCQQATVRRTSGSAQPSACFIYATGTGWSNSGTMTFYVYNGNGEIIQQSEEIAIA